MGILRTRTCKTFTLPSIWRVQSLIFRMILMILIQHHKLENYQMDSGSFLWTRLIGINSTQKLRPPRGEQLQIYSMFYCLTLRIRSWSNQNFMFQFRFRGRDSCDCSEVLSLITWGWFRTCSWWNCQHAVWRACLEHLSEHWIKMRTSLRCHGVSGSGMPFAYLTLQVPQVYYLL